MKTLILTTFFLSLNLAHASNPTLATLEYYLKNLNHLTPAVECTVEDETKISFQNCSTEMANTIEQSVSKILLPKMNTRSIEINAYGKRELKATEKIFFEKAKKTFECIQKQIEKKLKFECIESYLCDEPHNYYMYTSPTLDHVFKDKLIRVCPQVKEDGPEFIAGIIVHEVSHLCGTDDFSYLGKRGELDLKVPSFDYLIEGRNESGTMNADSYRYWFEKGFCLPEKDC